MSMVAHVRGKLLVAVLVIVAMAINQVVAQGYPCLPATYSAEEEACFDTQCDSICQVSSPWLS